MVSNALYVLNKKGLKTCQGVESNHVRIRNSYPGSLLLPFRSTSIRYIVPFVSTLPVHLILPLFRFNNSILFMYFFLSFQAVHVVASFHSCQFLYNPFRWTCVFYCDSSISFVISFLWFQRSPPLVASFLSFHLLPSVCCQAVHFVTSDLTFNLFDKSHLFLLPHRFTSYSPFVPWTLSLQLFPFIRYASLLSFPTLPFRPTVPFVSTLSFHSFLPSFLFTSLLSFVTFFRLFQLSDF